MSKEFTIKFEATGTDNVLSSLEPDDVEVTKMPPRILTDDSSIRFELAENEPTGGLEVKYIMGGQISKKATIDVEVDENGFTELLVKPKHRPGRGGLSIVGAWKGKDTVEVKFHTD